MLYSTNCCEVLPIQSLTVLHVVLNEASLTNNFKSCVPTAAQADNTSASPLNPGIDRSSICLCQHGPCMASLSTSSTCALSMANKLPFSASAPNTPSTFCLGRNLAVPWEARSPSGHVKKAAQALIPPRPREEVCFWLHCSRF